MSLEYYKIFHPSCLYIEGEDCIITSVESDVRVRGNCSKNKIVDIIWSAKDIVNHSYVRYKEQTSLIGVEVEFEQHNDGRMVDLSSTDDIQYLKLYKGKGWYEVPFGFLGKPDKFVFGLKKDANIDTIILPYKWIQWNSIFLTYSKDGVSGVCKEDTHFKVDYVAGKIILHDSSIIPDDADIIINGQRHKNDKYVIRFDRLNGGLHPKDKKIVDVKEIDKVVIPLKCIQDSYDIFSFELKNINTKFGDLWQIPSTLKANNVKLAEHYEDIKNINPYQLSLNHKKLGYNGVPTIYINYGEHLKFSNGSITQPYTLSDMSKIYIQNLFDLASKSVKKTAQVVMSLKNKYMPNECYLRDIDGVKSNILNPIHPLVIEYIKKTINDINNLNSYGITVEFLIDDIYWQDMDDKLLLYDDYTASMFKSETNNEFYLNYKFLSDVNIELLSNEDLEVIYWLNNKIRTSMVEIIGTRSSVSISIDKRVFEKDAFIGVINKHVENLGKLANSLHITNSDWNGHQIGRDEIYNASVITRIPEENIGYFIKGLDECSQEQLDLYLESVTGSIYELVGDGVSDIILASGSILKNKGHLLYRPMNYVNFTEVDVKSELMLCRANKKPIGYLTTAIVEKINRTIDDIDSIVFDVPYYIHNRFTHNMEINPLYKEIKEERLILLNESDYFVIKQVVERNGDKKSKQVEAQSLEHKLMKSDVFIEQEALQLYSDSEDGKEDGIINILQRETGWSLGYMEESAKFETVEGAIVVKYRWFEGVNTDWYTFLTDTVSKSFGCIIQFNSSNKTINIYNSETIGVNRGLYLSKDNYIISREKVGNTNDIVTRLRLTGSEELTIASINPTGQTWLENYSYFIEMGDVSSELKEALAKYDEVVRGVNEQWNKLYIRFMDILRTLPLKETQLKSLIDIIKELEQMRDSLLIQEDKENAKKIEEELVEKKKEKVQLELEVASLKKEKEEIDKQMEYVNSQLDKNNTLDENNEHIFTPLLISELNEFIYYDTHIDDTLITPEQLMENGTRILEERCKPLIEYSIDSTNFLKRLLTLRRQFNGELILGDVVILYDDISKVEVALYVVGFEYSPKSSKLEIHLSNKKSKKNDTKTIAKLLSEAKNVSEKVISKQYLWNKNK